MTESDFLNEIDFWKGFDRLFVMGVYAVWTVFQLFNSESSQIHISWTISNKYLTSPLSWHSWASRSSILIFLSAKGESHFYQY